MILRHTFYAHRTPPPSVYLGGHIKQLGMST